MRKLLTAAIAALFVVSAIPSRAYEYLDWTEAEPVAAELMEKIEQACDVYRKGEDIFATRIMNIIERVGTSPNLYIQAAAALAKSRFEECIQ